MTRREQRMAGKQAELPLGNEADRCDEDKQFRLSDTVKTLDRVRKSLAQLERNRGTNQAARILALKKVIADVRGIDSVRLVDSLEEELSALIGSRSEALRNRREHFLESAKKAGWPIKRLKDYDFVGGFQVSYKLERVTLRLGSEVLTTFEETEGINLFLRLQEERSNLEQFPFERLQFIELIKDAIQLARLQRKDRDGKIPIRRLFPLLVLVRQSRDERFVKRPVTKYFTEYVMAQFVYDLARFGREGWKTNRGDRLCNQPPNMATIARNASVTLPALDGDGSGGPQLGAIWVERV